MIHTFMSDSPYLFFQIGFYILEICKIIAPVIYPIPSIYVPEQQYISVCIPIYPFIFLSKDFTIKMFDTARQFFFFPLRKTLEIAKPFIYVMDQEFEG